MLKKKEIERSFTNLIYGCFRMILVCTNAYRFCSEIQSTSLLPPPCCCIAVTMNCHKIVTIFFVGHQKYLNSSGVCTNGLSFIKRMKYYVMVHIKIATSLYKDIPTYIVSVMHSMHNVLKPTIIEISLRSFS